jgi:CBS domain-containing protein
MTMPEAGSSPQQSRVRDYMTANPETLVSGDRLLDAELLIRRAGVRHIPVLEEGELVGVVSQRDVRRYAPSILDSTPESYNRIFEQTLVGTVMTRSPNTVSPDASMAEAVAMMLEYRLGCLLVVDGKTLVGILTRRDVMRLANDLLKPPE